MDSIVRSIDVGFRNTKPVLGANGHRIECQMFPSVAPTTCGRDLSAAVGRSRKTVIVTVEGIDYEVGPDVLLAQKPTPTRIMGSEFCLTPEYLALVCGALHWMRVDRVDLLVVGPAGVLVRVEEAGARPEAARAAPREREQSG